MHGLFVFFFIAMGGLLASNGFPVYPSRRGHLSLASTLPSLGQVSAIKTSPAALVARLGRALRFVVDKPQRVQYATAMSARFAFFLSQSLIISRLPAMQSTTVSSTSRAAALDVTAVTAAVMDAIMTDSPEEIGAMIPSVSSQSVLGSDEQRTLFAKNFAAIIQVLRKDLSNIEQRIYKMPTDLDIRHPQWQPSAVLSQIRDYVTDRETVLARSRKGLEGGLEIREKFESPKYPEYYLRNFHYQTDGWLSGKSAEIYDYQVESLFMGTADAMRRQIVPDIMAFVEEKRASGVVVGDIEHLDVATGTGRFISQVLENAPMRTTCLDLSPFYLEEAKKLLSRTNSNIKYCEAAAERMPFADASFDSISCVYMFHELPHDIRVQVVSEFARILKPNGRVFFVDSAQKGEVPYDRVLEGFTIIAHEPYYLDYTQENLEELFAASGLEVLNKGVWWVSKSMTFKKT